MRPPKERPPAKRGRSGASCRAVATADLTAACAAAGGSGRREPRSMKENWKRNVAIPLSDLQVDQNDRVIANVNRENLRQMEPYRRGAYRAAEPARPLRDILGPE